MVETVKPRNHNSIRNRLTASGALALSVIALAGCGLGGKKVSPHPENQIPPSKVVPEKEVQSVAENVASRLITLAKDRKIKIQSIAPNPAFIGNESDATLPLSERYYRSKFYQPGVPTAHFYIHAGGKLQDGMVNLKRVDTVSFSIDDPKDGYAYNFYADNYYSPTWTIAASPTADPTKPGYAAGVDSTEQLRPRIDYDGQVPLTEPALDDITHGADRAVAFLESTAVGP